MTHQSTRLAHGRPAQSVAAPHLFVRTSLRTSGTAGTTLE